MLRQMIEEQSGPKIHYGWDEIVRPDWKAIGKTTHKKEVNHGRKNRNLFQDGGNK